MSARVVHSRHIVPGPATPGQGGLSGGRVTPFWGPREPQQRGSESDRAMRSAGRERRQDPPPGARDPGDPGPGGLAIDPDHLLQRTLEVIPGLLIWGTLIGLTVLAFLAPAAVALFLIVYDLYWVIRAAYIGIHLVASYRALRRRQGINWLERLEFLADAPRAIPLTEARVRDLERLRARAAGFRQRRTLTRVVENERDFLADLRRSAHGPTLTAQPPSWKDILHLVILPTASEPLALLVQSLDAIAASRYPLDRLWVVVALEERAGPQARETQRALHARYDSVFGKFLTTIHPDGMPGERRVKSANATWAAKAVQQLLDAAGIPYERVLVSNFDADTVVSPDYFGSLTATYLVTPDRLRCSYQPLPLYHNNIWGARAFTRVIATNSTFWLLIQSTRSERLITFSSHAMPFRALADVGFWDPAVVSDDSRIFWQCYFRYGRQYRAVPLYTTVSMDVTQAPTLWRTFVNQYKQNRRWAWGVENFPYLVTGFLREPRLPRREAVRRTFAMLEGLHSWATAPLILAALGWIPILFGGAEFQRTVLAFNLPRVTRTLLTIATGGLVVNMALSLLLLPPAPPGTPKRQYAWMTLQWVLVPFIAWTLGTAPILDAVTRLMLGKYLGFWVTPKARVAARESAVAAVARA